MPETEGGEDAKTHVPDRRCRAGTRRGRSGGGRRLRPGVPRVAERLPRGAVHLDDRARLVLRGDQGQHDPLPADLPRPRVRLAVRPHPLRSAGRQRLGRGIPVRRR